MTGPDRLAGVDDLTPPDAAARLQAALGGKPWHGRHNDQPPQFQQPPGGTGLVTVQGPEGDDDGSA